MVFDRSGKKKNSSQLLERLSSHIAPQEKINKNPNPETYRPKDSCLL